MTAGENSLRYQSASGYINILTDLISVLENTLRKVLGLIVAYVVPFCLEESITLLSRKSFIFWI